MSDNDLLVLNKQEVHIEVNQSRETNIRISKSIEFDDSLREKDYYAANGCVMSIIGRIFGFLIFPLFLIFPGLFEISENEVAVMTYNGKYSGTIKKPGFYWVCPCLTNRRIVTLKQQNFIGEVLQVNDMKGNPLEIQMSMVWRIVIPEVAVFQVQNYLNFIKLQSEGALKDLASLFPYDTNNENEICLLRNIRQVNLALKKELNERFKVAGIICDEAALVHLHYPEEMAKMLLQKQEAEALLASKEIITKGIVSIAQNCIIELEKEIKLNQEERLNITNELVMILTDASVSKDPDQSPSTICLQD